MRISDWSSDVCSSDLFVEDLVQGGVERLRGGQVAAERLFDHYPRAPGATAGVERPDHGREQARRDPIGRASGRERVCQYVSISVVAVSLKKKHTEHTTVHKIIL